MKRPRFLFAAADDAIALRGITARWKDRVTGFASIKLDQRTALWFEQDRPPLALAANGHVIGQIHQVSAPTPVQHFDTEWRDAMGPSELRFLLRHCWGGYVVCAANESARMVLRAPMGDLPCYYRKVERAVLVAADVELLTVVSGPTPRIAWPALARHLAASDIRRSETALEDIVELPGGSQLAINDTGCAATELWSPWQFASDDRQLYEADEAVRTLRGAVLHSVRLSGSGQTQPLLKLSGGLDSSIVAASMAAAGLDFTCLNLVTGEASGDERHYARMMAAATDRALVERIRDGSTIDLRRSAAAGLPRPTARAFTQASDHVVNALAADTGATATIDGGGGDNVFCSLQSVRPVVDCMRDPRGRDYRGEVAATIATLAQVSRWAVRRKAWQAGWRRDPRYRWGVDVSFLSGEAAAAARTAADHPWFAAPVGALPGKAAHIALIAQAQSVVEGFDVAADRPTLSPLLAQPVVEACVRIPSWLWFKDGLNRAIARCTFADLLPPDIARRGSKGSPDGFIAEIYEANRTLIRDLLVGGLLDTHGLIDRAATRAFLDDPRPVVGHQHLRLLQLVDAEVWARSWQ